MDKRNQEGYADPTAYQALTAVAKGEKTAAKRRPIVYVASPYRGSIEGNRSRAREFCKFAVKTGAMPIAPHLLYPQFMDDTDKEQRKLGLSFALALLGKCDELWVFGENISEGMRGEIERAEKRGIPIRYFSDKCEEVRS